jgi:S-adenosyl-L-methionine hydrolase (adenosine-forming)
VIVALLTDFGTADHYVGAMKGVILSVCTDAMLVDITHDIPPQDVLTGALELAAAYRYFPAGTIFLAVVDPGVGSSRRAIVAEGGGYRFVGPDNGLLSIALRQTSAAQVVELRERRFARPHISRTFEGRDRFAPAAGWLALGTNLRAFGPRIDDAVTLDVPVATSTGDEIDGEIVRIDRFGNLISNIDSNTLELLPGDAIVHIGGHRVGAISVTYADVEHGDVCAVVGSTGHLEVAVNGGNAADVLNISRGASVRVSRAHG